MNGDSVLVKTDIQVRDGVSGTDLMGSRTYPFPHVPQGGRKGGKYTGEV